jgi:thiol:disulfide interchange protein DsbA
LAAATAWQVEAQTVATPPFEAGKHYTVLQPALATSANAGRIEVAEVFMFGCPGCYAFEPHLQRWLAGKADYIDFVRIPAQWTGPAILHARAYYTAEALGKLESIEAPFFDEIHKNGNHLETQEKLTAFFGRHGVDEATFTATFNSSDVSDKLERAEQLIGGRVGSTPTVIVNGKYATMGRMAGSYAAWFAIIDDLAAREHGAAGASQ